MQVREFLQANLMLTPVLGNRGIPATPRDGAPIEITGLLKSTLRWLTSLHSKGLYPHAGVQLLSPNGESSTLTYAEWDQRVMDAFEQHYYIPPNQEDDKKYNVVSSIVAR